eukprot:TRINITY_DN1376_c2_g5_i1.p1 TRINITY_DN1376_c2_g5~~TRINITY_DN1376_c2_g5_i1.p1  ORF type:complete len:284 (-),score=50.31 TRINITY_DN1376_c2_g5_i1:188-1039(-)
MPVNVIERVRATPFGKDGKHLMTWKDAVKIHWLECADIFAGITFIIGSICFLPTFAHDMPVFLFGCFLFIWGSVIYTMITSYSLVEGLKHNNSSFWSFETVENMLYLLGSLLYLVGTIMYWPAEDDRYHLQWLANNMSLGVYFNLFSTQFEGTLLFMIGSAMFAFAAFINGLNQRSFDTVSNQLLTTITSMYLGGALLFLIGSVAMLPDLGCNESMIVIGAWCFIVGSVMYTAASLISLYRTRRSITDAENLALASAAAQRAYTVVASTPQIPEKGIADPVHV